MKELFQPDDSADMNQAPISPRNQIPLERQTVSFSGDSRYLSYLQVYSWEKPHLSNLSQSESMGLELGAERINPNHQKIQDKIITGLKLLTFREPHVLVQFWSPRVGWKHQLLSTIDQPFGLGVLNEGLCAYRQDSEHKYFVLDNDHEEENHSPVARVFNRGFPEWTTDLNNYTLEQFPQLKCANRCNLHGYLGLPIFDSTTELCVGVLEVLTSSGYINYAHEVQNIHDSLKTVDLISPQVFGFPDQINALYELRQNDFDKIYRFLKTTCSIHSLPLAQTWAVSQHSSFAAHENVIVKSCSSFDNRCVGKVCMSRDALPYYVQDMRMWPFFKASTEQHLDRSRGLVSRALLSRGSCFCKDITKLSEEEYPLVHNARMNGLTSCFAIFLHRVEAADNYVLEFFLPPYIKDSGQVQHLVKTLKQNIPIGCGFELGDTSYIQDVGPLYANMVSDVTQTSSNCMDDNFMFLMYSSDLESLYPPVTEMMTARVTFNDNTQIVQCPTSLGLANLKNKVSHIFELEGEIHLKYLDEVNDLILIACDEDLKYAVATSGSNNSIDLICQPGI